MKNIMKDMELQDLIIFKEFADNEIIQGAVSLFSGYNRETYINIQREMVGQSGNMMPELTYWQNYIVNILAPSENIFSLSAEKGLDIEDTKFMKLACLELSALRELYLLDFGHLISEIDDPHYSTAHIQNIAASLPVNGKANNRRAEVAAALSHEDAQIAVKKLYDYFARNGSGLLESYDVFEWNDGLTGIDNYDTVTFEDLFGYETERNKLLENTEFLLNGKKAANALLYGDGGTGKSSSVKALISKYRDRGLKLISIDKDQITELPKIMDITRQRGCKFIIFIDDLSFEENEVEYKYFKSALEGNVKSGSGNTVIYVTSNRRNIVREVWSEREGSDDVHLRDTLQEKKSLSDRFGLVITYSAPTKEEYLGIVKGLAGRNGLKADDELLSQALAWDVKRAGRSGRTAKYFIDYYLSLGK